VTDEQITSMCDDWAFGLVRDAGPVIYLNRLSAHHGKHTGVNLQRRVLPGLRRLALTCSTPQIGWWHLPVPVTAFKEVGRVA